MEDLLCEKKTIDERVLLINSFDYCKYNSLARTTIEQRNGVLEYKQEYFKIKKPTVLIKENFLSLVAALEYFKSINFVHGDLNKKNIIYTNEGFKIIDYEPSLFQKKEGRKQFMATSPYISKLDIEKKAITFRTDALAFFYFILRINKVMSSKKVVDLCNTLDHKKFTGLDEDEFSRLSYSDILDRAYLDINLYL